MVSIPPPIPTRRPRWSWKNGWATPSTRIFGLRHPLGKVLELCFDLRLPLLSALLYKNTGGKRQGAGEGFYTLACEYKPQYRDMTPFDAWKQELALIRACKDWTPLRNYLDKF